MIVLYFGRSPSAYGNVTWKPFPMRGGRFPKAHPCHRNPRPTVFSRADQPDSTDPLGQLRARGYLASCFPEGDGISFDPPPDRTHAEVIWDFEECFGFEVEQKWPEREDIKPGNRRKRERHE